MFGLCLLPLPAHQNKHHVHNLIHCQAVCGAKLKPFGVITVIGYGNMWKSKNYIYLL